MSIYERFVHALHGRAATFEEYCIAGRLVPDELLSLIVNQPAEYWAMETRAAASILRDELRSGVVWSSLN